MQAQFSSRGSPASMVRAMSLSSSAAMREDLARDGCVPPALHAPQYQPHPFAHTEMHKIQQSGRHLLTLQAYVTDGTCMHRKGTLRISGLQGVHRHDPLGALCINAQSLLAGTALTPGDSAAEWTGRSCVGRQNGAVQLPPWCCHPNQASCRGCAYAKGLPPTEKPALPSAGESPGPLWRRPGQLQRRKSSTSPAIQTLNQMSSQMCSWASQRSYRLQITAGITVTGVGLHCRHFFWFLHVDGHILYSLIGSCRISACHCCV